MDTIAKKYTKSSKAMQLRVMVIASAIWSMDSNRRQHPNIELKIKTIFNSHPELDYWKRIDRIMHEQ